MYSQRRAATLTREQSYFYYSYAREWRTKRRRTTEDDEGGRQERAGNRAYGREIKCLGARYRAAKKRSRAGWRSWKQSAHFRSVRARVPRHVDAFVKRPPEAKNGWDDRAGTTRARARGGETGLGNNGRRSGSFRVTPGIAGATLS